MKSVGYGKQGLFLIAPLMLLRWCKQGKCKQIDDVLLETLKLGDNFAWLVIQSCRMQACWDHYYSPCAIKCTRFTFVLLQNRQQVLSVCVWVSLWLKDCIVSCKETCFSSQLAMCCTIWMEKKNLATLQERALTKQTHRDTDAEEPVEGRPRPTSQFNLYY